MNAFVEFTSPQREREKTAHFINLRLHLCIFVSPTNYCHALHLSFSRWEMEWAYENRSLISNDQRPKLGILRIVWNFGSRGFGSKWTISVGVRTFWTSGTLGCFWPEIPGSKILSVFRKSPNLPRNGLDLW